MVVAQTPKQRYAKQWYAKNREAVRVRTLAYYYAHHEEMASAAHRRYIQNREKILAKGRGKKVRLIAALGGCCKDCGLVSPDFPEVFDLDHLDPSKKFKAIAEMRSYSWERVKEEAAKCELVCANCHRIRTVKRAGVIYLAE